MHDDVDHAGADAGANAAWGRYSSELTCDWWKHNLACFVALRLRLASLRSICACLLDRTMDDWMLQGMVRSQLDARRDGVDDGQGTAKHHHTGLSNLARF